MTTIIAVAAVVMATKRLKNLAFFFYFPRLLNTLTDATVSRSSILFIVGTILEMGSFE